MLTIKKCIFSVPPRFATISGNTYFHANGDNVLPMRCLTDDSNPPADIRWYMNGQQVASTHSTTEEVGQYGGKQTSQILELRPTRDMDGRNVECRVTNSEFRDNVVVDSTVLNLKCKYFNQNLSEKHTCCNQVYKNIILYIGF